MSNTLATMQGLQDRVAETVQASFGALIPDEKFKELTDKAVNDYFFERYSFEIVDKEIQVKGSSSYYNNTVKIKTLNDRMTRFEVLVFAKLSAIVQAELDQYFTDQIELVKARTQEIMATPAGAGAFADQLVPLVAKVQQYQMLSAIGVGMTVAQENVKNIMRNSGINVFDR